MALPGVGRTRQLPGWKQGAGKEVGCREGSRVQGQKQGVGVGGRARSWGRDPGLSGVWQGSVGSSQEGKI